MSISWRFKNKPAQLLEIRDHNQGTKILRRIKPKEVSVSKCLNLLLRLRKKFLMMSQSPTQRKSEPLPFHSRQHINSTLPIRLVNGQKSLAHLLILPSSPPIILLFQLLVMIFQSLNSNLKRSSLSLKVRNTVHQFFHYRAWVWWERQRQLGRRQGDGCRWRYVKKLDTSWAQRGI